MGDTRPQPRDARELARRVVKGLIHDHSFHYAAGTAFRATLAIFPLLLGLITLLSLLGAGGRASEVLGTLSTTDAIPERTVSALQSQLGELDEPGPSRALGAVAAFLLALWAGAAAFRTVTTALNEALDLHDERGLVRRFFISLGFAALTATLATAATIVVALGPAIGELIRDAPGTSEPVFWAWRIGKWPLAALLVFLWLATTYAWAPADHRRFRIVTPGIIIAFIAWLAFAVGFSYYVDNVADQGELYGAFAGLIAFQLYVYWSALIVLVGAEVDFALAQR